MSKAPPWLTTRAIAHRGLHGSTTGLIENTLAAFEAAIARGFGIECDVQLTQDEEAVVFHDFSLQRLTPESGDVKDRPLTALQTVPITGSGETIPSLAQALAHISGRTPLFIEVKSKFDGDVRLADTVADCLSAYQGPAAVMSFDPKIVDRFRQRRTGRPVGMVAAKMSYAHWGYLPWRRRLILGALVHKVAFASDFIAYDQKSLPALAPLAHKYLGGRPLLSWTVKSRQTDKRIAPYVNQIIFEEFDPHGAEFG